MTLVECVLYNDDPVPCRVRVENLLDGRVWPPRRRGHPVAGWNESGVETTLAAGEVRGVGYACPAPPDGDGESTDPAPVEVTVEFDGDAETGRTAADVVAEHGDPRPPRDAL